MSNCNHSAWLHLSGSPESVIHNEDQLHRILSELVNPSRQQPSLILFVGPQDKEYALRDMFPLNNFTKHTRRHSGTVNLRVDTTTLRSDHPILFADSNPQRPSSVPPPDSHCHEITSHLLTGKAATSATAYNLLHARLLCLFADVVCLFGNGSWNEEDIIERLQSWAATGVPSQTPNMIKPRVIIVLRGDDASPTFNLLQLEDLQFNLRHRALRECFSSITVLRLADEQVSSVSRYRPLKELILRHVDEMRYLRRSFRCLFSANHLNSLFHAALYHLAATTDEPFDALVMSRVRNPVGLRLHNHLSNFLQLCTTSNVPQVTALSIMASSILLDAYPPRMHAFDPGQLYRGLYELPCFQALEENSTSPAFAQHMSNCVQSNLKVMFARMEREGTSAKVIHAENIRLNVSVLSVLRSNRTCLYCIRREPEHVLQCGHTVCDICTRIFGSPDTTFDFQYTVGSCLACDSGSTTITLKPPTSGVRVLTVDGGGIRGVVPLEFLGIIQDLLGPGCAIQDMFDLAFGTSSGGLIVLSLFQNRWPVTQCAHIFDQLTRRFFGDPRRYTTVVSRIRYAIKCWLSDSCYEADVLERALQEMFGRDRLMFDFNPIKSSTRIAVTATAVTDAHPVLLSNYNGTGRTDKDCGYEHLRPENVGDEPCIWEAARATSAAPVLFKPFYISSAGVLQDGGLAHNNPVNIAGWECRRIWPDNECPDILVSLGTGTRTNSDPAPASISKVQRLIMNGFVPRLWRSFMSSIDGQRVWQDVLNRLDQRTRENYFRLNVFLPHAEPAIDDISSMPGLRSSVHGHSQFKKDCAEVATALLVSSYYLELTDLPVFFSGKYLCSGSIRSRLSGHACTAASERLLGRDWSFVTDSEVLGHYKGQQDLCPKCSRYCRKVRFTVRHPCEVLTVYIQQDSDSRKRKISGFPRSVRWFLSVQSLDWAFGTPHQDADLNHSCEACTARSTATKRYAHEFAVTEAEQKRPRRV